MSRTKKFALIGNILQSVAVVLSMINQIVTILDKNSDIYKIEGGDFPPELMESFLTIGAVVVSAILIAKLLFSWIGYSKLESEGGDRGWRIFFLVIGILGLLSLQPASIIFMLLSILNVTAGVLYILVFVMRENK